MAQMKPITKVYQIPEPIKAPEYAAPQKVEKPTRELVTVGAGKK